MLFAVVVVDRSPVIVFPVAVAVSVSSDVVVVLAFSVWFVRSSVARVEVLVVAELVTDPVIWLPLEVPSMDCVELAVAVTSSD